jgi:integrase
MTSVFVRERKRSDGTCTYLVVMREGGRGSPQVVIASRIPSRREAEKIAREAKVAAQQARAGTYQSRITVGLALDLYITSLVGKASHGNQERNARLHIRPALDGLPLRDLSQARVQQLVDDLVAEGLSPQSVRHVAGLLRTAITHAKRRGRFSGENVAGAESLELPEIVKRPKDVLRPEEIEAVLPEVPDRWVPVTGLALYTCMRPGELFGCHKADVDVARRIIRVRRSWGRDQTKDRDERLVPVPLAAMRFLATALERAGEGPLLFPGPDGGLLPPTGDLKLARMLRTAMVRAAEKGASSLVTHWTLKCRRRLSDRKPCGFTKDVATYTRDEHCPRCRMRLWPVGHARKIRFYDLRHSGASMLINAGASATVVSAMLGHHDVEFTMKTYVDLAPDALVAEVDQATSGNRGGAPVRTGGTKRRVK